MRAARSTLQVALAATLACGCTATEPPPQDTVVPSPAPHLGGPRPGTLVPVASDVALVVRARAEVTVGESLGLELRVRNGTDAAVTVVRPVYGSWEHARQPDYRLEWTDERGEAVPDPLGFAPGLDCGVLDPILAEDRVRVQPGGEQVLGAALVATRPDLVLPTARPGRYALRVRYIGQDIPGATSLHLLSDPAPVTIRGGDAAKWACRAKQLADQADHLYANVTPAGLVPAADGGSWLVLDRYIHEVRGGVADPRGEIQLRKLGPDLRPGGDATVLLASPDEVGWLSVVPVPDGIVVVFTGGPVGGRSVQTIHVDTRGATPTASAPRTIQPRPGNPYFSSAARLGDRIAVLHHGGGSVGVPLMLSMLDLSGAEVGAPTRVAAMATHFDLQTVGEAVVATWLQRGDFDGGRFQRFDRSGRSMGAPVQFPLEPSHGFAGLRHHVGGLELAYADSGTRGDDPSDRMGLYLQGYDAAGRTTGRATALSPESRTETSFGVVAWIGGAAVHAYLAGDRLVLGRGPGDAHTVSSSAGERLLLAPRSDGLTLVWEDTRDDTSAACAQLRQCAPEAYAVLVRPDGAAIGPPVRLTHGAVARPLLPSANDWQRHCP
jgi:hypothetical protein